MREAAQAVEILTRLVGKNPKDLQTRQLLAQALVVNGQTQQAVQELEEAHASAPEDLELAFTLASGYLRLKRIDQADRLFAEIAQGAAGGRDPRPHRPHLPRLRRVRPRPDRAARRR